MLKTTKRICLGSVHPPSCSGADAIDNTQDWKCSCDKAKDHKGKHHCPTCGLNYKQDNTVITHKRICLGAKVKNKLGIQVPRQCKHCGDVWKQVEETKQGKRIIKRRVKCYSCHKRLYGNRAKV